MRAKKLSPQAYRDLLKTLRTWSSEYTKLIAPLIWHVEWLEDQIKKLESECRTLRQKELFETPKPPKPVSEEPDIRVSMGEYYYTLLFDADKERIERALKWKNKTLEQIKEIANQWAMESGNPLI